jgi:methyl-accepting chemotaxis protein
LLESSRTLLKCSLGQGGEGSVFQSAIDVMQRPLNFNDECLEITDKVERNLALVAGRIGRLQRFKAKLDASIAPLRILQTMFRIESASSPPEVLALFVSLSAEIELLMGKMSNLIAREFEAIESTGSTVSDVSARVRELHTRQLDAQKRRAQIEESMSQLKTQFETDKARDRRLLECTQAVSEKISGMVGALQYQDILNQRLQHVITGLENIAAQADKSEKSGGPDALCFLRDASRVESTQLRGVEDVFDGACGSLRDALEGLAEDMRALGAECILLNGAESPSAAVDGMVRVLLDTIRENTELVQSTSRQTREIGAAINPIGGLLGNLTGSILDVSSQIRLIALNAQIQAAQGGEGTGLEVLALRTRDIAEQMASGVAEIGAELDALKEGLADSVRDVEYACVQSTDFLRFLLEDGGNQEVALRRFRDRMVVELRCISELIVHIETESHRLSASLDMRSTVIEVVSGVRLELEHFSERLSAKLDREIRSTLLEQHALSYTAASERAAHERALREPSACAFPPDAIPAMVEGTVELF